jgi:hypothetical protein
MFFSEALTVKKSFFLRIVFFRMPNIQIMDEFNINFIKKDSLTLIFLS